MFHKLLVGLHVAVRSSCRTASCFGPLGVLKLNWKKKKFAGLQLFDFSFCFLRASVDLVVYLLCYSVLWQGVWSARTQTHEWGWLMTEGGRRQHCGNSFPLSSVITSVFPTYAHMGRQRNYCYPDTLNTLSKRMVPFLTGWTVKNGVQEGRRVKEGTQNLVRPPQGRFGIV